MSPNLSERHRLFIEVYRASESDDIEKLKTALKNVDDWVQANVKIEDCIEKIKEEDEGLPST